MLAAILDFGSWLLFFKQNTMGRVAVIMYKCHRKVGVIMYKCHTVLTTRMILKTCSAVIHFCCFTNTNRSEKQSHKTVSLNHNFCLRLEPTAGIPACFNLLYHTPKMNTQRERHTHTHATVPWQMRSNFSVYRVRGLPVWPFLSLLFCILKKEVFYPTTHENTCVTCANWFKCTAVLDYKSIIIVPRGKLLDSNIARVQGIVNTQTAQQAVAFCLRFPTAMPWKISSPITPLCLITRQSLLQKQNKTKQTKTKQKTAHLL